LKVFVHSDEIELADVSDFDLSKTFECGQCFRWYADDCGAYTGVVNGKVVKLRQSGGSVFIYSSVKDFEAVWRGYFDLDRDYEKIRRQLCVDDFMRCATAFGAGIRILRQDKWEALCSFIISQNNNIPRIKKIIENLCRMFGDAIWFKGECHYAFPTAARLASLEKNALVSLRCGYRAEYIIKTAKMIAAGDIDLEALSQCSPDAARKMLKKLHGVGDKVADCAMLYGLHMLDAFPLDVWMKKAVAKHFGPGFDPNVFKPHAGIAQQYIFYYVRNNKNI